MRYDNKLARPQNQQTPFNRTLILKIYLRTEPCSGNQPQVFILNPFSKIMRFALPKLVVRVGGGWKHTYA